MVWWLLACGAVEQPVEVAPEGPEHRERQAPRAPAPEPPTGAFPFEVFPSESPPAYVPLFVPPFRGEGLQVSGTFDHTFPGSLDHRQLTGWGTLTYGKGGHHGHDIVMKVGTPLYAMAAGEVVLAGEQGPTKCDGGKVDSDIRVRIRHPEAPDGHEYETSYFHMSASDVEVGDVVKQGQRIGASGNTGCSSGPHLHFGVLRIVDRDKKKDSWAVDPWGWWSTEPDPWAERIGPSPYLWKEAPPTQRVLDADKKVPGGGAPTLRFLSMQNAGWRDNVLPNEEVLRIGLAASVKRPRDLSGWVLRNLAGEEARLPPGTRLAPGEELRIHSGEGTPATGVAYLGSDHGLFDDAVECVRLYGRDGALVDEMPWGRKKEDPCGGS